MSDVNAPAKVDVPRRGACSAIGKDEGAAIALFGEAYKGIPKSVFAVAAYYLADACSDSGAGNGEALERLREEFSCLSGQVIDPAQAKRAMAALAKAVRHG